MTPLPRRKSLRYLVLKWHHRVGAVLALIIVVIAVTGILLNHTDDLNLDSSPVSNPLLLQLYGIEMPTNTDHYQQHSAWAAIVGQSVFFDNQRITNCDSLNGFVYVNSSYILACADKLILLTTDGDVIEIIDEYQDLPLPIDAIGIADNKRIVLKVNASYYESALEGIAWLERTDTTQSNKNVIWSQASSDENPNLKALELAYIGSEITLERFILDLHSGRIFGIVGIIFNDIFALLLISLAMSGFWIWNTRRAKMRKRL